MSTKYTKKNKRATSSSSLQESANGSNENNLTNVSLHIGFKTKTLLVLKFNISKLETRYELSLSLRFRR